MDETTLIEKLCQARGASGFEDEVLEIAREYCKDFEIGRASCRERV